MKIKNQTANTLVLSDVLADEVSQFQSGIKQATLSPHGSSGDSLEIPNSIAGESVVLQALLTSGAVKVVGGEQSLGGRGVPGVIAGQGVGLAFAGVIRTRRLESAVRVFRIMFGVPNLTDVSPDEVADMVITGFNVPSTTAGKLFVAKSADGAFPIDATISGTVAAVVGNSAHSGHVMITFTGTAGSGADASLAQAGYTVFAGLA